LLANLGVDVPEDGPRWQRSDVAAGTRLSDPKPMFSKVEALEA
jgi:hypothetical protein